MRERRRKKQEKEEKAKRVECFGYLHQAESECFERGRRHRETERWRWTEKETPEVFAVARTENVVAGRSGKIGRQLHGFFQKKNPKSRYFQTVSPVSTNQQAAECEK